jgi:hypothetical protein
MCEAISKYSDGVSLSLLPAPLYSHPSLYFVVCFLSLDSTPVPDICTMRLVSLVGIFHGILTAQNTHTATPIPNPFYSYSCPI